MTPDHLRQMREDAGLLQHQLAERLSTTKSTISKIEHGHMRASMEMAQAWALACGRSFIALGPEHDAALRAIGALTPDHAGIVLTLARLLPTLHPLRIEDLRAQIGIWAQSVGSGASEVVKKLSG